MIYAAMYVFIVAIAARYCLFGRAGRYDYFLYRRDHHYSMPDESGEKHLLISKNMPTIRKSMLTGNKRSRFSFYTACR